MSAKSYPLWKPITKDLPVHHWLGGAVNAEIRNAINSGVEARLAEEGLQVRVADTGATSPFVAEALSPEVIPVFVQKFPIFDMIQKVPSNGLSHTYQQQTSFTADVDPQTIGETGTVGDATSTYLRKTTNIAVFARRRGVTLKGQFAGQAAGGASADLMGREVSGGLLQVARDVQNESLRYQDADSTSTTTTAVNGKYDPNGFLGLRYISQNFSPPENTIAADVRTPWTDQRVLKGVRKLVNAIYDKGGDVNLIITSTTGSEMMFEDQFSLVRYVKDDMIEIIPGLTVKAISTDQGLIPVVTVPGNSVGTYINSGTFTDIWIVNTDLMEMPYLGSPGPSVLRIPTGADAQLRELAIVFGMWGLAYLAPQYLARLSLQIA